MNRPVHIHIETLVVHGWPRAEAERLGAAICRSLTRRLQFAAPTVRWATTPESGRTLRAHARDSSMDAIAESIADTLLVRGGAL